MKKIILTCLLAIASSVWTMSKAFCMAAYTTNETVQTTMNGYLLMEGMPCEDGEPCANCLTFALETGNGLYYLVTEDEQINNTLNALMMNELPRQATITGVPFKQGSFDYIQVYDITIGAYRLRHLCDEWNVMEFRYNWDAAPDEYRTIKYRLTTDTIIICPTCYSENYIYVKLEENGKYKGAMREDVYGHIHYIPAYSTNEYLLYAFNAEVGDTLNNVWIGIVSYDELSIIQSVTVKDILPTTPRTFILDIECEYPSNPPSKEHKELKWIEGVGFPNSPDGEYFPSLAGGFSSILLCAYKNGEQIYTSEYGEMYGCEYNRENNPADTIPLYIKDGPGSSTVEPVDPNEIVALLQKDQLSIYEYIDKELTLVLTIGTSNNLPARARQRTNDTFLHNMSVQLTEEGLYTIQLTNPEWDYIIEGKFMYPYDYQAIEATEVPVSLERKILRDGRLLIMHNSRLYTPMGIQVQ